MDLRFETRAALRVAYVRHVGPYQECGAAWQKLMAFAGPHALLGPNTLRLGIGHDNPDVVPPDKLRYDACISVDEGFQPTGDVGVHELPGGEYAVLRHRGSYAGMPDAYRWLFNQWLPTSGRRMRQAPCFEVYVSDPATTLEEELVTEICLPLAG